LQLLHHTRQVGQVVALDFDQAQAITGVLGQQRAHQRRLAGAARAPQQGVVGRHAVDELVGIAPSWSRCWSTPIRSDRRMSRLTSSGIR
jgi:hypothetical protein